MTSSPLGLQLTLSKEDLNRFKDRGTTSATTAILQHHELTPLTRGSNQVVQKRKKKKELQTGNNKNKKTSKTIKDEQVGEESLSVDEDDDLFFELPPPRELDEEDDNSHDDHDAADDAWNDDDDISLTRPPSTLPLFEILDVAKLVGYVPNTKEEYKELEKQLEQGMYQDDDADHATTSNEGSSLAMDFDTRTIEFLQLGMARLTDTDKRKEDDYSHIYISYPPLLVWNSSVVFTTSLEWKKLLRAAAASTDSSSSSSFSPPVAKRIFRHLLNCQQQSLGWKFCMRRELSSLIHQEHVWHQRHVQEEELKQWTDGGVRKFKLNQLYDIRDLLDQRVQHVLEKVQHMDKERQERVIQRTQQQHLLEQQQQETVLAGMSGIDGETTQPQQQQQVQETERPDDDGDDGWRELSLSLSATTTSIMDQQDDDEQFLRSSLEEEERILQECTTTEHLKLEGVLTSLQVRLQQVDDLLEELQEEEWADAEEEEERQQHRGDNKPTTNEEQQEQFTLLDNILAMILGSLPCEDNDDKNKQQQHYNLLKKEHEEIIQQWKETFGRLPPHAAAPPPPKQQQETSLSSNEGNTKTTRDAFDGTKEKSNNEEPFIITHEMKKEAATLRSTLGIEENYDADWENDDD